MKMKSTPIVIALAAAVVLAACAAPPASPAATSAPADSAANTSPTQQDQLDKIKARGTLRVSTDANYAPQSFFDEATKQWTGFDIDVATELAKRLGVKVEFVTPDWSAITAGNWADRWDVSVGSMTITEDRKKALDFTSAYYYTPAQFAARADLADSIKSVADLAGKNICAGESTTYEQYLSGRLTFEGMTPPPAGAKVIPTKTDAECIQSIQSGRKDYDAVLTALGVVDDGIKKGAPIVKVGTPVYYEDLAVALDKSAQPNARLLAALTEAVNAMHADGTLTSLSKKYYDGVDLTVKVK
jgi:polar amino acid transport system substrate-binding protein